MKRILLGVIGLLCLCVACLRKDLSFKPGEVWPDDKGVHINAHGGGILRVGDTYYWFGEHKTEGSAGNLAQVGVIAIRRKIYIIGKTRESPYRSCRMIRRAILLRDACWSVRK